MHGIGPHLMPGLRGAGIAALAALVTAGCAGGDTSGASAASDPGITLATAGPAPAPSPSSEEPTTHPTPAGAIDPRADLDIDDQRGDGTRVVIESLSTSMADVSLVILDDDGTTIASIPVTPGVQPVSITLTSPLSRSQELRGMLEAPGGTGILVDDEGEAVEEDFDYVIK